MQRNQTLVVQKGYRDATVIQPVRSKHNGPAGVPHWPGYSDVNPVETHVVSNKDFPLWTLKFSSVSSLELELEHR